MKVSQREEEAGPSGLQMLGYLNHRHDTCITVTSCVNRGVDMSVPFDEFL